MSILNLFVYGTLKPGESNYQLYCDGIVIQETIAIAKGQLFALPAGYPAMTKGNSIVHGFLLEFTHEDILRQLDELEGYQANSPQSQNLYYRQEIEVYNLQGEILKIAWAYLMTFAQVEQQGGILLPEGCWNSEI